MALTRQPYPTIQTSYPIIDFLPPYLLQDVFIHLDYFSLNNCAKVCRLWNAVITQRRVLRQRVFLKYPKWTEFVRDPAKVKYELHPIFGVLHLDSSVKPEETTIGRHKEMLLKDSPAKDQMATSPAATEMVLDLLKLDHSNCIITNENGVTVWDVVLHLAEYKMQSASFIFDDYFRSDICRKRGYDPKKKMQRKDMLSSESVFVTFEDPPPGKPLFVAKDFESRRTFANGEKKRFMFWTVFAFDDECWVRAS
ncbi:hypothetical protein RUND412_004950 [Rhizina undulata]